MANCADMEFVKIKQIINIQRYSYQVAILKIKFPAQSPFCEIFISPANIRGSMVCGSGLH